MVGEIESWRLSWPGKQLLGSNFNEMINAINAWNHRLRSWSAWNRVLASIGDEKDRWDVRSEFVEPLVFFCLHQPASARDRLTRFATQVVHVGNRHVIPDYPDELQEDAKVFKRLQQNHRYPHLVFLNRKEAEMQLSKKSGEWAAADVILTHVQELDDDNYRAATGDWRNRAAHGIPQHFEFGVIEPVRRNVAFAKIKIDVPGGVEFREDRTRKAVAYGFGGYSALNLDDLLKANQSQLDVALRALQACEELLRSVGARAVRAA